MRIRTRHPRLRRLVSGQCIRAWSIGADGSLGQQSVWAEVGGEFPDGICLDAEGASWIASGNHDVRVREGGEVTGEITLNGDDLATACALGGSDRRTLLITAAGSFDRAVLHASRTGVLYEAHVDVPGAGRPSIYE